MIRRDISGWWQHQQMWRGNQQESQRLERLMSENDSNQVTDESHHEQATQIQAQR